MLRRLAVVFWVTPALVIVGPLVAASCSGGNNADAGLGPCQNGTIVLLDCEPDDAGVVADRFTDEACDGLDTAESRMTPTPSDSQAPAVDAPTEAQAIPGVTPFTFRWHPQGLAYHFPQARPFRWTDDLARWTTPLPAAEAHCAPFGGVAYALVFSANNQPLLRVETANTSWTADAASWMRLHAATGTISLKIEAARFSDNTVSEGPFVMATPRTFTITP